MKRTAAIIAVLLAVFSGVRCSAAGGFTCEYAPVGGTSAVFYIDVCCADEVSAAAMELRFDEHFAAYREVIAPQTTSSVSAKCAGGRVGIVFADSRAASGRLCRVAFKALQSGDCVFSLSVTQAANAAPTLTQTPADYSVTVRLAGNDAASTPPPSKSPQKNSGPLSSAEKTADADEKADEGESSPPRSVTLSLREDRGASGFFLGAGAGAAAVILILLGFMIAKRIKKRSAKKEEEPADPAEKPSDGD